MTSHCVHEHWAPIFDADMRFIFSRFDFHIQMGWNGLVLNDTQIMCLASKKNRLGWWQSTSSLVNRVNKSKWKKWCVLQIFLTSIHWRIYNCAQVNVFQVCSVGPEIGYSFHCRIADSKNNSQHGCEWTLIVMCCAQTWIGSHQTFDSVKTCEACVFPHLTSNSIDKCIDKHPPNIRFLPYASYRPVQRYIIQIQVQDWKQIVLMCCHDFAPSQSNDTVALYAYVSCFILFVHSVGCISNLLKFHSITAFVMVFAYVAWVMRETVAFNSFERILTWCVLSALCGA